MRGGQAGYGAGSFFLVDFNMLSHLGHSKLIACLSGLTNPNLVFQFTNENFRVIRKQICGFKHVPKRNGEKGEMAVASSYAWPSVVVYRGATVAKR